jgi:hypothetical protein
LRVRVIIKKKKERSDYAMNKIFEKDRIILGAYILQPYARSEKHIKELAECGIELIV